MKLKYQNPEHGQKRSLIMKIKERWKDNQQSQICVENMIVILKTLKYAQIVIISPVFAKLIDTETNLNIVEY